MIRLLAGSLLALVLGAYGEAFGAEGSITFLPAAFREGETVTLRYAGVNADVPIQLLHDEPMIGRTRTVRDPLGTTSGKSGSITFTAPPSDHAYRVEIREPCTERFVFGECGALLASAALPLLRPELTATPHAYPGDTVTVRWDNAPVGAELFWSYLWIGGPVYVSSAGSVDRASGSASVRMPTDSRSAMTIGMYRRCTDRGSLGPISLRSCDGLLASAVITQPPAEISVQPLAYPGDAVRVTYRHAPVNAELYIISPDGPFSPTPDYIGRVAGPAGSGGEFDSAITTSGSVDFWTPTYHSALRIELRNPCRICGLIPAYWTIFASAPFTIGQSEFVVTPSEVYAGQTVEIMYTHAPRDAKVTLNLTMLGFGERFASGPSGTTATVRDDLAPGEHALTLHANCEYSTILFLQRASCSPRLATTTLRVLSDEPVGRSAPPTLPVTGRPTIAAPSAFATAPTALSSTGTPVPTAEPTIVVSAAPVATAARTFEPTPAVVASVAPPQVPARTFAPSPTPAPTPVPTLPVTPSPVVTAAPVPTVQPTVAPTKTPTPTQQPTASPTQKPNLPPKIGSIGDRSGKAGEKFVIGVSASDPDGDKLSLGCSGADKFTDHGNGTGTFEWTATKAGKYTFTCTASDGKLSSSTTFAITVS